ncbi:hypothetical protein [Timonella senegalensis]|uniref:hypothetical protein n=2 Tax=Timonella senegalensis TaxID=1465825 RepID=UPI002FDD9C4A
MYTGSVERPQSPMGQAIACVGAVGGVGTSTVALAVAAANLQSADTWFFDASDHPGSLEGLLGAESMPGMRLHEVQGASGRVNMDALRPLVLNYGGISALLHGRFTPELPYGEALRSLLQSVKDAEADAVVDASISSVLEQAALFDAVVLVAPLSMTGLAGAFGVKARIAQTGIPAGLVLVERVRLGKLGFPRGDVSLSPDQFAQALGLPVWSVLQHRAEVGRAVELGFGPLRAGGRSERQLALCGARVLSGVNSVASPRGRGTQHPSDRAWASSALDRRNVR